MRRSVFSRLNVGLFLAITLWALLMVVVWTLLTRHEQEHLQRMTDLAASNIQADIHADLHSRFQDQSRLAHLWEVQEQPSRPDWESTVRLYMEHYPGSLWITWVDAIGGELWRVPATADPLAESVRQLAGEERKRAFDLAQATRQVAVTRAISLPDGRTVMLAVVPAFRKTSLRGFVVDALEIKEALRPMVQDVSKLGYNFLLVQDGKQMFQLYPSSEPAEGEAVPHSDVDLAILEARLRVWPSSSVISEIRSLLPVAVVALIGVLGAMVLLTWRLAQVAHVRTQMAREALEKVEFTATERRVAEQEARTSEAKFAGILRASADAIITVSEDHRIILFNQGAEKIFGHRAEEVIGKDFEILVPERLRAVHKENFLMRRDGGVSESREVLGLRKDGTEFPAEATVTTVVDDGEVTLTTILRDVTDKMQVLQELRRAHDELEERVEDRTAELAKANEALSELSSRLLASQEEERRRIARELHDSTSQELAVVAMSLHLLDNSAAASVPGAKELIADCAQMVQHTIEDLRTVSYRLHPPMLDEFGLAIALDWYVKGFSKRSGAEINVHVDPNIGRLHRDVELTIFRIVQEALTNVHRHSHSKCAGIRIHRDSEVRVEVADEGTGIPRYILEGEADKPPQLGVGIAGMRERVRQLGGTFTVHSTERGTTVIATFPEPDEESKSAA